MPRRSVNLRTCFVEPLLRITPDLLNEVMRQVVEASAAFIENLNRAQLGRGLTADGDPITPDYSPTTVFIKEAEGKEADFVTLKETGAFYESIYQDVFEDYFMLKADDPKTAKLIAKYSPAILGLSDESKAELIRYIKPLYIRVLRSKIGL